MQKNIKSNEKFANICYNVHMKYIKQSNKIIIQDLTEFNPEHIIECGQVFRYTKCDEVYQVFSANKTAFIVPTKDNLSQLCGYEIVTDDVDYFENYFDLKQDYASLKSQILKIQNSDFMRNAINFGSGIRLLNQDHTETIIAFVISQNNNIKRIQQIIEKICQKFGTNMGGFYAFPTIEQLSKATSDDFKNMGAGYRATYLVDVIKFLQTFDSNSFEKLSQDEQLGVLLSVNGIGPKVADCILLFGYHNMTVFPVDTWIEKVYKEYFFGTGDSPKLDRKQIRKNLVSRFGNMSGYAQQYLFYYQRSSKK